MFINNINPDIITVGPLSIRFYGMVYALGFLLINHILMQVSKKKKIKNLTNDRVSDLVVWSMILGIIGARIFNTIIEWGYYSKNPAQIIAIWNGGLAYQGGLAFALVYIYYYCKKYKISVIKLTDIVAAPMALTIAFGRIANFINSEHLGFVTNVSWCVKFVRVDDLCRHPAQIYQAFTQFLLFGILILLGKHTKKIGIRTWTFITGYGFLRFITDFYRTDMSRILFGLTLTQIVNLLMFFIGLYFIIKKVNDK
ncbi:prolipoprotein diacylglyceryl transferase [archaeon]|jgi:phosphatidylglycerol---prolipoprotein diacylglyceryl transferase|nr:prolipoprotein diacylglyceryl transferase [archaeon]MBT4022020.1 prolipoprotein diacylglyceryl transferase [archaeon]MBT4272633.1 prolipoprotein diacylglyceryl transferase [archaeon]MBT4461431.1 prolipoprotein diacylglyceryl transferase [archaeon]MBT4857799.1 prolipoprotein diacylglyceryl transferase [archaeon]